MVALLTVEAQKEQRRERQERLDKDNQDLHESAKAEDKLERQLRMEAAPAQLMPAPTPTAVGPAVTTGITIPSSPTEVASSTSQAFTSDTITPAGSAPVLATTTQSSSSSAAGTTNLYRAGVVLKYSDLINSSLDP